MPRSLCHVFDMSCHVLVASSCDIYRVSNLSTRQRMLCEQYKDVLGRLNYLLWEYGGIETTDELGLGSEHGTYMSLQFINAEARLASQMGTNRIPALERYSQLRPCQR